MIKKLEIPIFHGWLYLYQGVPFAEVGIKHNIVFDKSGCDAISSSDLQTFRARLSMTQNQVNHIAF